MPSTVRLYSKSVIYKIHKSNNKYVKGLEDS